VWGGTHNARGWFLTPGCDRACVQDDEPFDWETDAGSNAGPAKQRGAKGNGREKDKERRERKEREREKRDKEKVRQLSHRASVVDTPSSAGGLGSDVGGGGSDTELNHGGARGGSTLQHAAVEAPYRPGGARDAPPLPYAPGGNAARARGDTTVAASSDGGGGGGEQQQQQQQQQSLHASAARICFDVVTRGSCVRSECSLFHPPRNPPRAAQVRLGPTRRHTSHAHLCKTVLL
jgi:hypothetical protein